MSVAPFDETIALLLMMIILALIFAAATGRRKIAARLAALRPVVARSARKGRKSVAARLPYLRNLVALALILLAALLGAVGFSSSSCRRPWPTLLT